MIAHTTAIACLWIPTFASAQTPTGRSTAESGLEITPIAIAGRIFQLEFALGPRAQHRGLGGRSFIEPYGGMLFAYPSARPLAMVMRDCPIPIDVAFLSEAGRVVALHAMEPEYPRGETETPAHYESRLPSYSSREPARFAVELAGGRLAKLGVKIGDPFVADWSALASQVR